MQNYLNHQNYVERKYTKALLVLIVLFTMIYFQSTVHAITDTWLENNDGTVTDVATGLIWQQNNEVGLNHADSTIFCQGLSLAGKTDWRLPNIKELLSLVDFRTANPAIDRLASPNASGSFFWSSTSFAGNSVGVWTITFDSGLIINFGKENNANFRCVS